MMVDCGIVGDTELSSWIEPLGAWCTVSWGTDDPIDAVRRIQNRDSVTTLFVQASVHHLTALLMSIAAEYGVRIVAIVADDTAESWIEALGNIDVVRTPAEAAVLLGAVSQPDEAHVGGVDSPSRAPWFRAPRAETMNTPPDSDPDCIPAHMPKRDTPSEEAAIESTMEPHPESTDREPVRRMVAVWGPIGSPGRSTVAIGLAVHAAQSGASVLLIDADSYGSSLAIGLGLLDEAPGFAACCRLAGKGELTPQQVTRLAERVVRHGIEFAVLTGIPRAGRWGETERHKAQAVVACVREMFDIVIVDCGFSVEDNDWIDAIAPRRNGTTQLMLSEADATVVVGLSDPVGLARLIRGVDDIAEWCERPLVVLNRTAGSDAAQAHSVLRRFSTIEPCAVIPPDSRTGLHDAFDRARGVAAMYEVAIAAGICSPAVTPRRRLFGR